MGIVKRSLRAVDRGAIAGAARRRRAVRARVPVGLVRLAFACVVCARTVYACAVRSGRWPIATSGCCSSCSSARATTIAPTAPNRVSVRFLAVVHLPQFAFRRPPMSPPPPMPLPRFLFHNTPGAPQQRSTSFIKTPPECDASHVSIHSFIHLFFLLSQLFVVFPNEYYVLFQIHSVSFEFVLLSKCNSPTFLLYCRELFIRCVSFHRAEQ